jgi:hypothetical protein
MACSALLGTIGLMVRDGAVAPAHHEGSHPRPRPEGSFQVSESCRDRAGSLKRDSASPKDRVLRQVGLYAICVVCRVCA